MGFSMRFFIYFLSLVLCTAVYAEETLITESNTPVSEPIKKDLNGRLARVEKILDSRALLDMFELLESLKKEVNFLRGKIEVQTYTLERLKEKQRELYTDIDNRLQRAESNKFKVRLSSPIEVIEPIANQDGSSPLKIVEPIANQDGSSPLKIVEPIANQDGSSPLKIVEPIANQDGSSPLKIVEPIANQNSSSPLEVLEPIVNQNSLSPKIFSGEQGLIVETDSEFIDKKVINAEKKVFDPQNAEAVYQRAFNLLKKSQYDQAKKAFKNFLKNYPESDYSDNAQYWLGETNYVMQKYDIAINEYQALLSIFPNSKKVSHALLKIGYSYAELGNVSDAEKILIEVVQEYPGTTAARLAEERLRKISVGN